MDVSWLTIQGISAFRVRIIGPAISASGDDERADSVAIANPIADVLSFVGTALGGTGMVATMVGQ